MQEFRDETGLWAAGSASPAEDSWRGARLMTPSRRGARKIELVYREARSRPALAYGPHAALAARMIAVAWMGSRFDPPSEPSSSRARAKPR